MTVVNEELQMLSFTIILHAGNGRSISMEAIKLAKDNNIEEAKEKIKEANEEFVKAHHEQTQLLRDEASGKNTQVPIILVHAQDHLMTALAVSDLAKEMIDMYQKINVLGVK